MKNGKSTPSYFQLNSPGKASNYFKSIIEARKGSLMFAYIRVSSWQQFYKKNHYHQIRKVEKACKDNKLILEKIEVIVGPGHDSTKITMLAHEAKSRNGFLLAISVDRAKRSFRYNKNDQSVLPTVAEFEEYKRDSLGVISYTVEDPDSTPTEIRAEQVSRGRANKKKHETKGKHLRNKYAEIVAKLSGEGLSCRQIMCVLRDEYDVSRSFKTVSIWVKQTRKSDGI